MTKLPKPYTDEWAISDAMADLRSLENPDPSRAEAEAHIEKAQAAWLEEQRHTEIVEAARQGAASAAASANAAVLTVAEAAEFLRCSERTVVRMINRGSLKASKSTGKTLVRRGDLEKVLER